MRFLAAILASALLIAMPAQAQLTRPTTRAATQATALTKPAADPAEFALRKGQLKDDDIEGRLTLARWARDREMYKEAVDLAQDVLWRDPGNRAAYLILQQVDEARPLPPEPDMENSLKNEFSKLTGHDFKTRTTRHFLLAYDTTDVFATQRGGNMEKVFDAFQFYFTMSTLRPEFLQQHLTVILFKNRDDYLAYMKKISKDDLSWSAGFYSARLNRSAFFDDATGTTAASFARQSADLKSQIDELTKQIDSARATGDNYTANRLNSLKIDANAALSRAGLMAGNTLAMMNTTTTLHEAAHQIAFNIGVQKRMVDYPFWLSEGLACAFEMEDSQGRRGPALINYGRVGVIKDALAAGKLLTVDQLVNPAARPTDTETLSLYYAQGWGLFHYLYKYNRNDMEKFLQAYNKEQIGVAITPDHRKKLFADAFGADLDTLNKKYAAYLKSLPVRPN